MHIKHLISGSSGCAIAVWGMETMVLIDAGWRSQKAARAAMVDSTKTWPDAIIASHLHKTDHISYSATKVFAGIPFYVPETQHEGYPIIPDERVVEPFEPVTIGEFTWFYSTTKHDPKFETRAIHIKDNEGVTASFCVEGRPLSTTPFLNRDYLYVEANHNTHMLEQFPNPNSWHHMSNEEAGQFIKEVCERGEIPQHITIGNISNDRNTRALALDDVVNEMQFGADFIYVAQRERASKTIQVLPREGDDA